MSYSQEQIIGLILEVLPKAGGKIRAEIAQVEPRTVTLQQFRVLTLVRSGICFAGELSQNLGVSQAAMSKFIDHLESLGWVTKSHCPEDGRKFIVKLTRRGSQALDVFRRRLAERLKSLIKGVDSRRQQEIGKGLAALSCLLDNEASRESVHAENN